jgi:DNA-binding CsgD family transcriptional regulator
MPHRRYEPESSGLLNRLLRCTAFADLQGEFLGPAAHALRSTSAALVHASRDSSGGHDIPTHSLKRSLHVGPLSRALECYADGDFRLDPLFNLEAYRVHRCSLHMSRATGGERFRQFLLKHDIHETFGVALPITTNFGTQVFALSFQRRSDADGFQRREFAFVEDLVPALQATLRNFVQQEMLDLITQITDMSALTCGHVVPDSRLRIPDVQPSSLGIQRRRFGLTAREMNVVGMIAEGLDNATAGQRLGISVRTVENHLRSVYAKIGVRRRTQMLARLFNLH